MDYRNMDYRERYKLQYGYTDEMLELDDLMEQMAKNGSKVKIVLLDGTVYIGEADGFCKADDEEDGFSTISIKTEEEDGWYFRVNDIKSIEEIE